MCRGVKKMYDSLNAISLRDEGVSWFHFILLYLRLARAVPALWTRSAWPVTSQSPGEDKSQSQSLKQEQGMNSKAMNPFQGLHIGSKQLILFPFLLIPFH
jgi:hypothetical protein